MAALLSRAIATVFAVVCASVAAGGPARAQDARPDVAFDRYRVHTPAPAIRDLALDGDGFLFLATPAGLLRYDGRRFDFMNQLPETRGNIVSLAVDGQGALWAASVAPAGVVRLWRGQARLVLPLPDQDATLGTTNAGDVLVVSDRVVTIMRGARVARTLRVPDGEPFVAVHQDAAGVVWLGGAGGLQRFDEGRWTKVWTQGRVTAVAPSGADGRLLLGTRDHGVIEFDARANLALPRARPWRFNMDVKDLVPGRTGEVLVGLGDGVVAWHTVGPEAGTANNEIDQRRLPDLRVTAVVQDRTGNLFVGTESGVLLQRVPVAPVRVMDGELGLHQAAFGLLAARDGTIYILEGTGTLTAYHKGALTRHLMPPVISTFNLRGLAEADDGTLYAGSLNGPLYRFRDGVWDAVGLAQGLPRLGVRALVPVPGGGAWLSFEAGGIAHWDGRRFTAHAAGEILCQGPIVAIDVAPDQALWLASDSDGLCRFDPRAGRAQRIGPAQGWTARRLSSMRRDAGGLWIATHDAGLWREQQGRFVRALPVGKFPGPQIGDLLDDGRGSWWLTSFSGLARVNRAAIDDHLAGRRASVPVLRLGVADGLPSASFIFSWPNVAARDQGGRLWFATVAGVVRVDDPGAAIDPTPPRVQVDGLRLDGQEQADIHGVPIEAPQGRGNLEIAYSTPTLAYQHRVRFEYRLAGLEEEFTDAGDRTVALYTGLPPGRFTFEVRAVVEGQDVERRAGAVGVTRLSLRLVPPFSRTPAWKAVQLALVVGLLGVLVGVRRRQRAVRAGAVAEERARLGRELHDTLDQTFVAIDLQLQSASAKLRHDAEVKPHLDRAHALLDKGLTEARASIWALRADHPGEGGLAGRIAVILGEMTRGTPVRNEFRVTGDPPALPPDVERELSRIVGEAIANALRHARPSQLVIAIDNHAPGVDLTVTDDGCGFAVGAPVPAGDDRPRYGLRGMRERAERAGASVSWESRTAAGAAPSGTVVRVRWPAAPAVAGARSRDD